MFKKIIIIAEAGVNHNGDLKLAKKLVDAAKNAGADAVTAVKLAVLFPTNAEAIFNGEVLAIQTQSEGKKSVLIRHGNYISIYNNLESVYVSDGEKVKTGQPLGKIFTDRITGKTKLIFVLSKNTTRLNPTSWILRN